MSPPWGNVYIRWAVTRPDDVQKMLTRSLDAVLGHSEDRQNHSHERVQTYLSFAMDGKLLRCPVRNGKTGLLANSLAVVAGVVFNAPPRVRSHARK